MDVTFQEHPDVWLGSSVFRNIPVIIQCKEVPMLEVTPVVPAGFRIKFEVYHNDGNHIATVNGSQIYLTEAGKKARITQRYPPGLTVCELEGQTILELRRDKAAALRGWAELYAPEGVLIRSDYPRLSEMVDAERHLVIGDSVIRDGHFEGSDIGIQYLGDGNVKLGIRHLRDLGPAVKTLPFDSKKDKDNE